MPDTPLSFNAGGTGFGIRKRYRGLFTSAQRHQLHPVGPPNSPVRLTLTAGTSLLPFANGTELVATDCPPIVDAQNTWVGLSSAHVTVFDDAAFTQQTARIAARFEPFSVDGVPTDFGVTGGTSGPYAGIDPTTPFEFGIDVFLRDNDALIAWDSDPPLVQLLAAIDGAPGFIIVPLVLISTDVATVGLPPGPPSQSTALLVGPVHFEERDSYLASLNGTHELGHYITIPLLGTFAGSALPWSRALVIDYGFDVKSIPAKLELALANTVNPIVHIEVVSTDGPGLFFKYTRNVENDTDDVWSWILANIEWSDRGGLYGSPDQLGGSQGECVLVSTLSEQNATVGNDGQVGQGENLATFTTTFYAQTKLQKVQEAYLTTVPWVPVVAPPPVPPQPTCKCETPWWLLLLAFVAGRATKKNDGDRTKKTEE